MTPDNHPALPELPEAVCQGEHPETGALIYGHTADQMRAYALESLRRADGATLGEGQQEEVEDVLRKAMGIARQINNGTKDDFLNLSADLLRLLDEALSPRRGLQMFRTHSAQRVAAGDGHEVDPLAARGVFSGWRPTPPPTGEAVAPTPADIELHAGHVDWCADKLREHGCCVAASALDETATLLRSIRPVAHPAAHAEGRVMVPTEPTADMLEDGDREIAFGNDAADVYRAMLAVVEEKECGVPGCGEYEPHVHSSGPVVTDAMVERAVHAFSANSKRGYRPGRTYSCMRAALTAALTAPADVGVPK